MTRPVRPPAGVPVALAILCALVLLPSAAAQAADPAPVAEPTPAPVNEGLGPVPVSVDRSTPRATWTGLLRAVRGERYGDAAHYLRLVGVDADDQPEVGPEVARRLGAVLAEVDAPLGAVPDDVPREGIDTVSAFEFSAGEVSGEVLLDRVLDGRTGRELWLVSRRTVSDAALWYQALVEGVADEAGALNAGLPAPPEDVDRSTPRETVEGFLVASRSGRFDVAAHFLDLAPFPVDEQERRGRRAARRLKIVLDRTFWVDLDAISDEPGGAPEAELPSDLELLTVISLEESSAAVRSREIPVLLARHGGVGTPVWSFSSDTVAQIDRLYREFGSGWFGDHLPAFLLAWEIGEVQLWQWIAILLMIAIGWIVAGLIATGVRAWLSRLATRSDTDADDWLVEALHGPLRLGLLALLLWIFLPLLHLSDPAQATAAKLWKPVLIICLAWVAARAVTLGARVMASGASIDNEVVRSFVPIFSRIGTIIVWVLAVVVLLGQFGFEIVGLVTGLGIGGIAIAFAAQKTIENVFGSFAIAGDRPFRIGDFVSIAGTIGTIEDVGLRSTRIRTLARTVVTMPNSSVMSESIENYAVRDRFLYNPTIGVLYSTSKAQLEYVLDEIKRMLVEHPQVFQEVTRVRFSGFGDSALNISVFCWVLAADFAEYTTWQQDLNFRIFEIVEASGTGFAFPSRTIYTARDGGIDEEKRAEAERLVERRRADGDLWVPERPPEEDEAGDDPTRPNPS